MTQHGTHRAARPPLLTVGVVTPHAAAGPEVELPAMTRGRVATVVSRTGSPADAPHAQLLASTEPAALDRAAATFAGSALAAVAHASTTTGYVIGHREEAALVERLADRFDVPAVTSSASCVAALRTHGAERVQLVHPPWFGDELDELGAAYFRSQGLDAVVTRAAGLPADPARVAPQRVVDWVEHHLVARAGALVLAGNGFRAASAVDELETRTGRLVIEANQALLWGILAATATGWDVAGHGRLLRSGRRHPASDG